MKTFFAVLAIMSCVFIGNVEGIQQRSRTSAIKKAVTQAAQNEHQILLNNCAIIRANIASQFSGMGSGAIKSSGFKNTVKQEITNYLNSVGTQTARQLLSELQANGFQGFYLIKVMRALYKQPSFLLNLQQNVIFADKLLAGFSV